MQWFDDGDDDDDDGDDDVDDVDDVDVDVDGIMVPESSYRSMGIYEA